MPGELTTVASFRDVLDAEAARSALEAEGIPSFIENTAIVGLAWYLSQAVGGLRLKVAEVQAEAARRALSEDHAGDLREEFPDAGEDRCPRCGSADLHLVNLSRKPAAVSWMTGIPIPVLGKRIRCGACGWRGKGPS